MGETTPAAARTTIPGATTTEIKASHVPFLSHPKAVARIIGAGAR